MPSPPTLRARSRSLLLPLLASSSVSSRIVLLLLHRTAGHTLLLLRRFRQTARKEGRKEGRRQGRARSTQVSSRSSLPRAPRINAQVAVRQEYPPARLSLAPNTYLEVLENYKLATRSNIWTEFLSPAPWSFTALLHNRIVGLPDTRCPSIYVAILQATTLRLQRAFSFV